MPFSVVEKTESPILSAVEGIVDSKYSEGQKTLALLAVGQAMEANRVATPNEQRKIPVDLLRVLVAACGFNDSHAAGVSHAFQNYISQHTSNKIQVG
jgi:hypothetical protein